MSIFEKLNANTVRVTPIGVAKFNAQWPASPLDSGRFYTFEFQAGSLTDANVPEFEDGRAALALCDDAQGWLYSNIIPEWAI